MLYFKKWRKNPFSFFFISQNLKSLFIIIKISCFYCKQNCLNPHYVDYRQFYCNVKVPKILLLYYCESVHMKLFCKKYDFYKIFYYARVVVCVYENQTKVLFPFFGQCSLCEHCHACMHGFIRDNRLRACQSCL